MTKIGHCTDIHRDNYKNRRPVQICTTIYYCGWTFPTIKCVCFFVTVLCNRHLFNRGAPVDIGALIKTWVTVSWQGPLLRNHSHKSQVTSQDRDWQAAFPGQDHMDPFGFIGVEPRYIPAGAVSELAGIRLSCTSTPTSIRKKHRRGESDSGSLIPWWF